MTGQFFNKDKKNRRIFQIAAIVIILISFWSFGNSFQAAYASVNRQQNPITTIPTALLPTASPTPEVIPTPTEITAEVIREGKPIGILVGAIVIVLIIFLSTIPQLIHYYRENQTTKLK